MTSFFSQKLILLIDDDQNSLGLLQNILGSHNFRIEAATSTASAFNQITIQRPDLIIMELALSDANGLSVIRELQENVDLRTIPILVLSRNQTPEDVARALASGVRNYLTKPVNELEILENVHKIFSKNRPKASIQVVGQEAINEMNSLSMLPAPAHIRNEMLRQATNEILPVRNHQRMLGYEYPLLTPFFRNFEEGIEIKFLEKMVQDNFLIPHLIDVVQLCPACGHHDINIREICPGCKSINISKVLFYRHKKCGQKIWMNQLSDKNVFLCQSCDTLLSPNSPEVRTEHTYHCQDCHHHIQDLQTNSHCLNCGKISNTTLLVKQKIYAYQLQQTESTPPVKTSPKNKSGVLEKIVQKISKSFLAPDAFVQKIDLEILRAKRHQDGLTLIAIDFREFFKTLRQNWDHGQTKLIVHSIQIIDRSLRKSDSMSVKNGTQILLLLPCMHQNLAKIVGQKILYDLNIVHSLQLEMTLSSFPEDGANSQEILNILELGLETLNENL